MVSSEDYTWGDDGKDGWYVVTGSVTIESRVTVSGNVHLILTDGCYLLVDGGIQVQDDDNDPETTSPNALTIYAQSDPVLNADGTVNETYNKAGKLTTQNVATYNAGIGGSSADGIAIKDCGTITINGGIVTATATYGAGIGGSDGGSGGTITINGGKVKANSPCGAGIGGGSGGNFAGSGGIVTINGGTVTASSNYGAGIGSGAGFGAGLQAGSGGDVTITGGVVTATCTNMEGIGGTFSPGIFRTNNGNAVLFATSIGDQSNKSSWSGIIFEGDNDGIIYGTSVTPTDDFTIPTGKTLTIGENQTLTIPEGKTLTNEGTIDNSGKIFVDGTLTGTVSGDGMVYYRLTVNGGTAAFTNPYNYNNKTYATAGSEITLSPDTHTTGYSLDKWILLPSSVTVDANNSFTMPSTPLEITAQWIDIQKPVITGLENNKTYCDVVEFTVSDNGSIASVKANDVELTATNGKYTLAKGAGTVTVVAADNSGNTADVTVTVNNGHTGGIATCTEKAECDYCYEEYGELDSTNHSGSMVWDQNETQHKKYWNCCDAVVVDYEDHTWVDGVCSECDYICTHKDADKDHECDFCGEYVGIHADTNSDHYCDYCGEQMTTCKDENPKDHNCDICEEILSDHTYEWQSENGQYWQKCSYCDAETEKKAIPAITISGADVVCKTQDYRFVITVPEGVTNVTWGYDFERMGTSNIEPTIEDGEMVGTMSSDYYASGETGFRVFVMAETADGFVFAENKTVAINSEHTDAEPKDHLCDVCGATLSEHTGGEATCVSKAVCEYCGEEYGELDSTNHNLENIPAKEATVTETGNIEYWHCLDCGKYFADENGENEIELSDTVTGKLPPEIIEGAGQSVTEGEKKELTFSSNAAYGDFIRAQLDGKTIDAENYTATEGSTIITLKADFVGSLSVGEHTIGIVSESGTAATTFTVNAKPAVDNPDTGDNSHMALLVAIMFVSGGAVAATVVSKKKKHGEN